MNLAKSLYCLIMACFIVCLCANLSIKNISKLLQIHLDVVKMTPYNGNYLNEIKILKGNRSYNGFF